MRKLPPISIRPALMNYAWGRRDPQCWVARLAGAHTAPPWAEVWYGAHPSAPSWAEFEGEALALDMLIDQEAKRILGQRLVTKWGNTFPFMGKVISVGSPLSIQVHPRNKDARDLHHSFPEEFPDPLAKSEASIALREVELLYGFRRFEEIRDGARNVPELHSLLGEQRLLEAEQLSSEQGESAGIKSLFSSLMRTNNDEILRACQGLYERISRRGATTSEEHWILRVRELFPRGDSGAFCFYFMNLVRMPAGSSIFLPPGLAHAYLSGEFVEVMISSDNVARCALTPKRRDIETLLRVLDYSAFEPTLLKPEKNSQTGWSEYRYPLRDFLVDIVEGDLAIETSTGGEPQILLCLEGSGEIQTASTIIPLSFGAAFLMPADFGRYQIKLSQGKLLRFRSG